MQHCFDTYRTGIRFLIVILVWVNVPDKLSTQPVINLHELDEYFASALNDWKVPGMAIAIVKENEVVLAKGYGVREVGESVAVDEHTQFAIASNTKAFIATTLAILVDEGRITWDDRVTQHLPWFQLYDPYVTADMRIRDLLSHRSGLGTYSGDLLWYGTTYSAEEVVRRARYLQPASVFRGKFGYSNIMFIAAGEVISAVSDQRWDDFVRQRILDKLGMNQTVTSVRNLTNAATPHIELNGDVVSHTWTPWNNSGAAGGIISTVSDIAKWLRLQLNYGAVDGDSIFSEESSAVMWTPHIAIPLTANKKEITPSIHFTTYGLGWNLWDYHGRQVISHGGGYDGMFSQVALVPEENLGMVILTNSMTGIGSALMYRIIDMYIGAPERNWSEENLQRWKVRKESIKEKRSKAIGEQIPNTKPSLPLGRYTGSYDDVMYGDATVTLANGTLELQFLPNMDLHGDLRHWHYDTFSVHWRKKFAWFNEGTVQFIKDSKGEVIEMVLNVPNEDFWFHELEFKRKVPMGN
jgi:CubicO group peptidase (beta-lactamase class C family)